MMNRYHRKTVFRDNPGIMHQTSGHACGNVIKGRVSGDLAPYKVLCGFQKGKSYFTILFLKDTSK